MALLLALPAVAVTAFMVVPLLEAATAFKANMADAQDTAALNEVAAQAAADALSTELPESASVLIAGLVDKARVPFYIRCKRGGEDVVLEAMLPPAWVQRFNELAKLGKHSQARMVLAEALRRWPPTESPA